MFRMFLLCLTIIMLLTSCGLMQSTQNRKSVLDDPYLSEDTRRCIQEGKIKVGMTKQEVWAAWPLPDWTSDLTRTYVMDGVTCNSLHYPLRGTVVYFKRVLQRWVLHGLVKHGLVKVILGSLLSINGLRTGSIIRD